MNENGANYYYTELHKNFTHVQRKWNEMNFWAVVQFVLSAIFIANVCLLLFFPFLSFFSTLFFFLLLLLLHVAAAATRESSRNLCWSFIMSDASEQSNPTPTPTNTAPCPTHLRLALSSWSLLLQCSVFSIAYCDPDVRPSLGLW